ncbi:rSAM-associated Gly-rich repeat protein [Phormidium sp. LEGE 05292]|uniref:GrrA/OscA1 family cyclophane-containing rSAM-modified RiPP n=1 Tax=[Phormidium] sp. LEGE 05292 TaxID=767427 RepID=UPI001880F464|nr:GrrA/OscA1 family cyclophane-containing rSAM-modified RiPP [Phormidium sp. LEGE 05292]MBE9224539.1 rSAM-associated Gly-rich repeat protein [Phormidium sp. LEGE 05292]
MNITTRTGLVGFFLALSALQIPGAMASTSQTDSTIDNTQQIESRLARITAAIRQREPLISNETPIPIEVLIAGGWKNGGGGGFANRRGGGGFANGGGGGFVNARPWVNGGWVNGGGFYNYY